MQTDTSELVMMVPLLDAFSVGHQILNVYSVCRMIPVSLSSYALNSSEIASARPNR